MSYAESEAVLKRLLEFLQRDRRIRLAIAAALVAVLLALALRSLIGLVPRSYTLTITGGDIVTNRHYLAKIVQDEVKKEHITLVVKPVGGMHATLEAVSNGTVDLALIQGGLATTYPNVEHVATVVPELVHLLVKPAVHGMADLRGRSVNLGDKGGGVREIGLVLTHFAGYVENTDYVETNYSDEALLALPDHKMPDAILTISSVPSYLVEILVRKHHYQVVEIPFPEALALRHGWVANGTILGYTYNLNPPVPEKNIVTVAVNMHLVANSKADPNAVAKVLEVLYGPSVASRLRQSLDEKRITVPSGYPFSAGLTKFLTRNDSVITLDAWNKLQSSFGLIMSFAGMFIVMLRWFRGGAPPPVYHDAELHALIGEVAGYESEVIEMGLRGGYERPRILVLCERLGRLHVDLLKRYAAISLKDPRLFDVALATVTSTRQRFDELAARAQPPGGGAAAWSLL